MTADSDHKQGKKGRHKTAALKTVRSAKATRNTSGTRFALSIIGFTLMLISPIIGALPGPGFIILFPIGLALVLQNSRWAKRRYVDFKRRFPQYGKWTDWAMRRKRHKKLPDDFELPIFGKVKTKSES
ncbi:PGPGW domain-containing protein [Parasphingorhabdus sp. JC815]|uniref:PGPGW domain-containing protein n=1 Tax=Parasphingorhabdus sp. JC815 TaxID=3232140 RepID=UPI003459B442